MTTLSTHDTKRGEDTRARLGVLSRAAAGVVRPGRQLRAASAPYRSALLDGRTEYLLWQTLVGTWTDDGPIAADRLVEYLTKAVREAKSRTTWTAPDEAVRARGARDRTAGAGGPDGRRAAGRVGAAHARRRPRRHARHQAGPAHAARRRRRLPGHGGPEPGPRRPGQPTTGRRRPPRGPVWPAWTTAPDRATSRTRSCWSRPAPCGCAGLCPRRSSARTAASCRWPTPRATP